MLYPGQNSKPHLKWAKNQQFKSFAEQEEKHLGNVFLSKERRKVGNLVGHLECVLQRKPQGELYSSSKAPPHQGETRTPLHLL